MSNKNKGPLIIEVKEWWEGELNKAGISYNKLSVTSISSRVYGLWIDGRPIFSYSYLSGTLTTRQNKKYEYKNRLLRTKKEQEPVTFAEIVGIELASKKQE